MGDLAPILVTGAGGFLGQAIVTAARRAGHPVRALLRREADAAAWQGDDGVVTVLADLAEPSARTTLAAALEGVAAVIHAAASLGGGESAQQRDTVAATAALIEAMAARRPAPRLVIIGSLSVYNYASLPMGATLDETTPLEPEPQLRDAYARGKLAQEALAVRAAQAQGLAVRVLRAGAIIGPGRMRTARLGVAVGPMLLMPGGAARIPLIAAGHCAAMALRAATAPMGPGDPPSCPGGGCFEAINAVEPDPPTQADYAAMLANAGWPQRTIRLPLKLARAPAQLLALAGLLLPRLVQRMPGLLRLESFDARFKPLHYASARAEDRLGWRPDSPLTETIPALLAEAPP
jgi:nucleoside-diphosphate-sugar epimerase